MILHPQDAHQISFGCRADDVVDEPVVVAVDRIVDGLDLSELYGRYSERGRSFYSPSMMLKVLFYSYCEGVRSSREIAKRVRYDVRFRYYTGSLSPDFRTINRFRLDNLDLLGDYFAQIVTYAQASGYLDVSVLAIDGTKIRASSSGQRVASHNKLAGRCREELHRDAVAEASDSSSDDDISGDSNETITKVVRRSPEVADPDARFMKTSEGGKRLSYNSHIAVDKRQLIVAAEVSTCADDSVQLQSMLARCRENIIGDPGAVLADGGDYSGPNVKHAAQTGIDLYMPITATGRVPDQRYHRDAFVYDSASDSYLCPAGERLFYRSSRRHRNVLKNLYSGCSLSCGRCSERSLCTTSRYRRLEISENYIYELQMKYKMASSSGQSIYRRRMSLVEGVFGNLKFNLGFRRFHLRGLDKVRGEFFLMCIAHNLKKLARLIPQYSGLAHAAARFADYAIFTLYKLFQKAYKSNLSNLQPI